MREAGAPSTVGGVTVSRRCARPTGGSHSRITDDPVQHGEGAKGKPRQGGVHKARARTVYGPEPESPGPKEDGTGILLAALLGEHFSGSCTVTSRNPLIHNGATNGTKSKRFDHEEEVAEHVVRGLAVRRGTVCYRELPRILLPRTSVNRFLAGPCGRFIGNSPLYVMLASELVVGPSKDME